MGRFAPTILLVDDHDDLRDAMALLLSDVGYDVRDAGNGLDALAHLHSQAPIHGIILDLDMPVMNGWEFLAECRTHPVWSTIPILVLTGVGDQQRRSAELQGVQVFTKPFNFDALLAAVRRVMIRPVVR